MAFQGLLLVYSGGTGNTDPHLSIGGQAAQATPYRYVTPQKAVFIQPLPGVSICVIRGSSLGTSWLIYHPDDHSLVWILPGTVTVQSDAGPAPLLPQTLNMPPNAYPPERYSVFLNGDGFYEIGNGAKSLLVSVTEASLPATRTIFTFTIEDNKHNIFDPISYVESNVGTIEYRCLYVQNKFADPVSLRFVITSQPANSFITIANQYKDAGILPSLKEAETGGFVDSGGFFLGEAIGYSHASDPMHESYGFNIVGSQSIVDGYQITDGITGDIALLLADESDSTNLTSSFFWSTDAVFSRLIAVDGMVSIWFRRLKVANPTAASEEVFGFEIQYQGDELTTPWEVSSTFFVTLPSIETFPPVAIASDHKSAVGLEDNSGLLLLEDGSGLLALEGYDYD